MLRAMGAQSDGEMLGVLLLAVLVLAAVVIVLLNDKRRARESERTRLAAESAQRRSNEGGVMSENERVMFEQHKKLNDLAIQKLEAEVQLLQAQVKSRADDDDRLHAAKEYHELSVEKTKLEIDSLRLHITEQRKRMEDWGGGLGGAG